MAKDGSNIGEVPIDYSWSFSDKTTKDTNYITHGFYTYPAKFIPQLASRLIKEYSKEGDIVIDPFLGSGTTVIESIMNNRIGIGVDINDIAYLIAKVKSTPIKPKTLLEEYTKIIMDLEIRLNGHFKDYLELAKEIIPPKERIDYWFKKEQKDTLSVIFCRIQEIKNKDIRDFFFVVFAQILKSTSIWLQKSIKPTRDLSKRIIDPYHAFLQQIKKNIKKHEEFYNLLSDDVKNNIDKYRIVKNADSRNLPCEDKKASLIITSPPYVTSYEYADLHQLPSLWFNYLEDLSQFRKKFIGSAYKDRTEIDLKSKVAESIIQQLGKNKKAREVKNYFADMLEVFIEMNRVLKKTGKACIVIGNTAFRGVSIFNAEVYKEQMENLGFQTIKIIHREIPSKMLPSTRDPKTGMFTSAKDKNQKLAYPTEYILIMEKK